MQPKDLIGKKIVSISPMTKAAVEAMGWYCRTMPSKIELDDGTMIIAMRDEEGNGPGVIYVMGANGDLLV
jgi:uroporphyrinogen-III synthase